MADDLATWIVLLLSIMLHILASLPQLFLMGQQRYWPPLRASLASTSWEGLIGAWILHLSEIFAAGLIPRQSGSWAAQICNATDVWLAVIGVSMVIGAPSTMAWRHYNMFCRCKSRMWPSIVQTLLMYLPTIAVGALVLTPIASGQHSPETNTCDAASKQDAVIVAVVILNMLAVTVGEAYWVRRLAHAPRHGIHTATKRDMRLRIAMTICFLLVAYIIVTLAPPSRQYTRLMLAPMLSPMQQLPFHWPLLQSTWRRDPSALQQFGLLLDRRDAHEPEHLEHMLDNTHLAALFRVYIEQRHADENYNFYMMVKEHAEERNAFARQGLAIQILRTFLDTGAPHPINISSGVRRDLLKSMDLANPKTFAKARAEIVRLMITDVATEYMQTPEFEQALQERALHARQLEAMRKLGVMDEQTETQVREALSRDCDDDDASLLAKQRQHISPSGSTLFKQRFLATSAATTTTTTLNTEAGISSSSRPRKVRNPLRRTDSEVAALQHSAPATLRNTYHNDLMSQGSAGGTSARGLRHSSSTASMQHFRNADLRSPIASPPGVSPNQSTGSLVHSVSIPQLPSAASAAAAESSSPMAPAAASLQVSAASSAPAAAVTAGAAPTDTSNAATTATGAPPMPPSVTFGREVVLPPLPLGSVRSTEAAMMLSKQTAQTQLLQQNDSWLRIRHSGSQGTLGASLNRSPSGVSSRSNRSRDSGRSAR